MAQITSLERVVTLDGIRRRKQLFVRLFLSPAKLQSTIYRRGALAHVRSLSIREKLGGCKTMARFYFHIRRGDELLKDEEGINLPNEEAARKEGLLAAREILAEMVLHNEIVDGQEFQIADDRGIVFATIPFLSVIRDE